jgi:F-type H+-transporting ATPase subunit epsilon
VLIPSGLLLDEEAAKVNADGADGAFCLLPRHADFVSALVPGLLAYTLPSGEERYVAHDEAVLVKCGAEVLVSTRQASGGADLDRMEQAIADRFRAARRAGARGPARAWRGWRPGSPRRFLELGGEGRVRPSGRPRSQGPPGGRQGRQERKLRRGARAHKRIWFGLGASGWSAGRWPSRRSRPSPWGVWLRPAPPSRFSWNAHPARGRAHPRLLETPGAG